MAAVVGVVYALAVMVASTALWMPWVMVIGRAPGDSIASALGGALFVIGFGMPMFAFAGALLFAPVLVLGGAAVGVAAMSIERRYLPTIS